MPCRRTLIFEHTTEKMTKRKNNIEKTNAKD